VPCFSVGGECGIGSAEYLARQSRLRTYLVYTSTSMDSLRQVTTLPSQTRPRPQFPPPPARPYSILREFSSSSHSSVYLSSPIRTPNISPNNRSIHIDVNPSRPSTVQITHTPSPTKVNDAKATSRGGLTSITFYPDSPTGSSAPSTPALAECEALSPQSESMPLTPRLSFEEDVDMVPSSPSPWSSRLRFLQNPGPPVAAQRSVSPVLPSYCVSFSGIFCLVSVIHPPLAFLTSRSVSPCHCPLQSPHPLPLLLVSALLFTGSYVESMSHLSATLFLWVPLPF